MKKLPLLLLALGLGCMGAGAQNQTFTGDRILDGYGGLAVRFQDGLWGLVDADGQHHYI